MQHDPIDYETIERRVRARVRRRFGFLFHTAIFVLGIPIVGGWGSALGFLIWVGAWILHLIWMIYQNNIEKEIEREIEYEREKILKRKRDRAEVEDRYRNGDFRSNYNSSPEWLGDDGELRTYDHYEEDIY